MISFEKRVASSNVQLYRRSFELGYHTPFANVLSAVHGGTSTLTRSLSNIALFELWRDFIKLVIECYWSQGCSLRRDLGIAVARTGFLVDIS